MTSLLNLLVSILLYFKVVTGQVIARNVLQEEVLEDPLLTTPPIRQMVSVTINGTVYELDTGVCTGGVMMKRKVPVEEFCGVGVFSTRPSGCSSEKEKFIGVNDQYTCSRVMSEIQGFLRVVVEDEFTTPEDVVSSTENLTTTTTTEVTSSTTSTEAVTVDRVEINSEAEEEVTIKPVESIIEEVTTEAPESITEMAVDSEPVPTVISSTTTESTTTSEGTTTSERVTTSERAMTSEGTLIEKNLALDQIPVNDVAFEHNNLIEKRGVKIEAYKEEIGEVESTTEVGGISGESFSVEEIIRWNNKSKIEDTSTTPKGETTPGGFEEGGGESTIGTTDKTTTTEDGFAVEFEVVKNKRESKKGEHSEEDTLPLEESGGGLAGRSDDRSVPGMPYDVKPAGFKKVAAEPKQKVIEDQKGNEVAGEGGNEGSEEDTLPINDDGVEIPLEAMLAGRTDDLREGMGVEQVGFGLKVEVVDWSSEKDELGGPWMSGEEESMEDGYGIVDARGWGIEEWIEMPPPSPLFDAHATLLRKQVDFELLKGGRHEDEGSEGSSPHVSVISEKEIQYNSTWYQIISEIAATASLLIPEELFRDPFSGSEGMGGARYARGASGGKRKASKAGGGGNSNNTTGGGGKPNNATGGGGKPNNTTGGGESQTEGEVVVPRLPIFADLLRIFGWFTRSYESSVVLGEKALEEMKNGFKMCRQAAEGWRQRIVLGEVGGCEGGVEIKSIRVDQPVWNEYNASYTTVERLLNFTSTSTDLPPIELRINAGKWIFAELLWYAVQLTYTFCFESFSELDPNGFMTAYDVILRLFGSELVKGLWEEVGGNLGVFELVLPFVKRGHGGGEFSKLITELDKISGGIRAGGFVNGFGRGKRRWDEERGGRVRNSWDEGGRILRRRKRDVGGDEVASVVKVVEEGDVSGATEAGSPVVEGMSTEGNAKKSKLWLNVGVVSTQRTTTEKTTTTTTEASTSTTTQTVKPPPKGRVFDQTGGWFVSRLLENKTVEENDVEGEGSTSSTTSLPPETSVTEEVETETTPIDTTEETTEREIEVEMEEQAISSQPTTLTTPQETKNELRKYEIWGGLAYCLETEGGQDGNVGAEILKPSIGEMVEKGGLVC